MLTTVRQRRRAGGDGLHAHPRRAKVHAVKLIHSSRSVSSSGWYSWIAALLTSPSTRGSAPRPFDRAPIGHVELDRTGAIGREPVGTDHVPRSERCSHTAPPIRPKRRLRQPNASGHFGARRVRWYRMDACTGGGVMALTDNGPGSVGRELTAVIPEGRGTTSGSPVRGLAPASHTPVRGRTAQRADLVTGVLAASVTHVGSSARSHIRR